MKAKSSRSIANLMIVLLSAAVSLAQLPTKGTSTRVSNEKPRIDLVKGNLRAGEHLFARVSAFAPYEAITVDVNQIVSSPGFPVVVDTWVAFADESGSVEISWPISSKGSFLITATGSESQTEASRSFSASENRVAKKSEGTVGCVDLNADNESYPQIDVDWGFKVDVNGRSGRYPMIDSRNSGTKLIGGTAADPENSIAVITSDGSDLAFESTRPVSAVIARGVNGSTIIYAPEFASDKGPISLPDGEKISQAEFCLSPETYGNIVIIKHATPPSTFKFGFNWYRHDNGTTFDFDMTDDDPNSDPSRTWNNLYQATRTIRLTDGGFYDLRSIDCTVSGRKKSTYWTNLGEAKVTIDLRWGDTVTCTFSCDFVTAAYVSASGMVVGPGGRSLPGAIVFLTDVGGTVRTVRANSFGKFRFDGIEAGNSYLFNAAYKGYRFNSQLHTLDGDREGIVISAAPR